MRCKVVLVLIDGIGDVSLVELKQQTPLQVAHIPFMDSIAAAGLNGLMDSVEPGLACGSDTSHLSIFGYDPRVYYRGRGAFESMGAGIHMDPGDIAFKCNFATYNPDTGIVEQRRADRYFEEIGPILCSDLNGLQLPHYPHHRIVVKYATEHRCGVVIKGPGLSDQISGTDPLKDNRPLLKVQPLDGSQEAQFTAELVNELCEEIRKVLSQHQVNKERAQAGKNVANVVLLRGCGSRQSVTPFQELHGMKACMVAPTKIIAGLGITLGMDRIEAPGATGFYDSQFHIKAEKMAEALTTKGYEFGFIHVKAVDDTGHDRNWPMKVRFLETVDKMIGQLLKLLWQHERYNSNSSRYVVCVTGDHSTPVIFGDHSYEPVPFAVAHVEHVVDVLGGEQVLDAYPLGPIKLPDMQNPPLQEQLLEQGTWQKARRLNAKKGVLWMGGANSPGEYNEPWPQKTLGDSVLSYDEISAARGSLGRFPGSQAMTIVKKVSGVY